MNVRNVGGFKVEVTSSNLVSHVRLSMEDGTVIVDTDRLSVAGLERLSTAIATAAHIARANLPPSWQPG